MRPIVLVKQFLKISRTVEFDLIGVLNLEILNFKDRSSSVFPEKIEIEIPSLWIMLRFLTGGAYWSVTRCVRGKE